MQFKKLNAVMTNNNLHVVGACITFPVFNICKTPWSAGYLTSWCNCCQLLTDLLHFGTQIEPLLGIGLVKPS